MFFFAGQIETPTGYEITLQKQGTYTLFGGDVETLTMDVRFETNERLHIKVNKWSLDHAVLTEVAGFRIKCKCAVHCCAFVEI